MTRHLFLPDLAADRKWLEESGQDDNKLVIRPDDETIEFRRYFEGEELIPAAPK